MDRLSRIVTHGGLALMLSSTVLSMGCRGLKSEIPPAKAYSTTGAPTPNVGFSSAPRPDAAGAGGLYNGIQQASGAGIPGGSQAGIQQAGGDSLPGGDTGLQPQYGTPIGNKNKLNEILPAEGKYGPPGTSSLPASNERAQFAAPPETPTLQRPPAESPLQGALGVDLPSSQ